MKKTFRIGQKEYKFKKDAIAHYRTILNAYDFGQSLNDSDFDDLIDLLNYAYFNDLAEMENSEQNIEEERDDDNNIIGKGVSTLYSKARREIAGPHRNSGQKQ